MTTTAAPRRARRELRAAAVLLLVQGALMEGLVAVGLVVLLHARLGRDAAGTVRPALVPADRP
ncbi:hypothetical protein [Clavibacter nebraskensis]|uniref:Uncharacterized protein n=2 Tax=Clavibacter nebraskensis TaxID=31963 RepID=A0AAI8ZIT3_9MICO|nr:hypothetical protein [Clavibacter nebraskensis]KXU20458.1 hypothetical protein VV38_09090 [Clavibacter nebraskensis]OAH17381.1 hypothetical protein A3Q38_12775 [Clavibacter nebraskensis]QGV67020.1 hypothetical protein EGX36_09425 [Clavibacter nebraskensis]QGV69821.1 hypothetical protein EGX37_09405 [Clavibacter nebraskensis]QGV72612.1 hypothetical protein EGX35_09405 [Clavibacter nebraskensis]